MPVTRPFNGTARKGMSLATLITSLFIARVVSAGEFQDCLYFLIAHPIHFDRLCAMHTMVTQANYRLCKAKYWMKTKAFSDRLGAGNLQNPAFSWAQDGPSNFFVTVCWSSFLMSFFVLVFFFLKKSFSFFFWLGYSCYS